MYKIIQGRIKAQVSQRLDLLTYKAGWLTHDILARVSASKRFQIFEIISKLNKEEQSKLGKLIVPSGKELNRLNITSIPYSWIKSHCYKDNVLNLKNLLLYQAQEENAHAAQAITNEGGTVPHVEKVKHLDLINNILSQHKPIQTPERYSEDSIIFKVGKYSIEVIDEPDRTITDLLGNYIQDMRQLILDIYKTDNPALTDGQIIERLSLNNAEMADRHLMVSQAQVVRLDGKVVGTMTSRLEKVDDYYALYIPVTMMKKEGQGRKLHIRMAYESAKQAVSELIWHQGILKGLRRMIFGKGLPIIVRTNTRRAMLDLKKRTIGFFIPTESATPTPLTEKIIRKVAHRLNSTLDDHLIARNVYNGPIALKRDKTLSLTPEEEKMYNQLGEHDAFFAVGYANYIILNIVHRELKRIEDSEKKEEELKRKKAEQDNKTNKVSLKV